MNVLTKQQLQATEEVVVDLAEGQAAGDSTSEAALREKAKVLQPDLNTWNEG